MPFEHAVRAAAHRPSLNEKVHFRRLIREAVPMAFEKCFEDRAVQNWARQVQVDILSAAGELGECTVFRMKARCFVTPRAHSTCRRCTWCCRSAYMTVCGASTHA